MNYSPQAISKWKESVQELERSTQSPRSGHVLQQETNELLTLVEKNAMKAYINLRLDRNNRLNDLRNQHRLALIPDDVIIRDSIKEFTTKIYNDRLRREESV